ncbi:hypothetical protein FB566_4962 [Stackebrandtia endophytica]|uniref:Uncharacterized protein n=1 Tax=Stackebrandtia endophytica TaxID=1496996 RepID=A0A543B3E5_9ACTN|nr:hypothetical protein [Stackebrandtia endophytica]TQL79361.1 hypothetical protein FB566_4962 [Stackebrandtia endophytica]
MTADDPTRPARPPLRLMYLGLALSVLATAIPLIDVATVDTLTEHVRDAYPQWPASLVAADHDAIIIYLSIVNGLGILGWLWAARGVGTGARWTKPVGVTLFSLGALMALVHLTVGGDGYQVIVPYAYGLAGLLPVIVGAVALAAIWRRRP